MGKPWNEGVPIVTAPQSDTLKPITIVMPFYENHLFFEEQTLRWWGLRDDLRLWLNAIIVDDGSPCPAKLPTNQPFPIRLFRIDCDVRWNWLAARNIGAHHAADGWILLTDIDHVVPEKTLQALITRSHDPGVVYAFSRREHTGERIGPHSASFFMTRQMFWKIGGYDERFSGYYGTDGIYRRRLMSVAPIQILTDELIRFEYVGDSSTSRYARKQPQDASVSRIAAKIPKGSKPKVLTFPYNEVTT